jgi:hypothetical protein
LVSGATGYRIYTAPNILLGATTSNSWTYMNLLPNRFYSVGVYSVDFLGRDGAGINSSTYTYSKPSSGTVITGATGNSVTLQWWHNGNPAYQSCCWGSGQNYRLYSSSNSDFSSPVATSVVTTSSFADRVAFASSSLRSATTYYFRVQAYNSANFVADYDLTVSTPTLLAAPASITWSSVGTTSATWSWSLVAGATGYRLYNNSTLIGSTTDTFWTWNGLLPNRIYTLTVKPVDSSNREGDLIYHSTYTLSNPSSGTVVTAAGVNSMTLQWWHNGNPPYAGCCWGSGQNYYVYYSTASNFASPVATQNITSSSLSDRPVYTTPFNLLPATTYYYRVRAYNSYGVFSDYDLTISSVTTLPAPSTMSWTSVGVSSISWSWALSTPAVSYRLYTSTNGLLGTT